MQLCSVEKFHLVNLWRFFDDLFSIIQRTFKIVLAFSSNLIDNQQFCHMKSSGSYFLLKTV